jgi:hypothetical protein
MNMMKRLRATQKKRGISGRAGLDSFAIANGFPLFLLSDRPIAPGRRAIGL